MEEEGVGATGLGLLLEEHRGEIVAAWRARVQRELGVDEPALSFAVAPLLRELVLALGDEERAQRSHEAWARCAVLVRSTAGAAQLVRELKALRRCTWDALRARGAPVTHGDRGVVDAWLDDALAEALDRLERVRLRVTSHERATATTSRRALGPVAAPPPRRPGPPPLPSTRGRPPVVVAARRPPQDPDVPILEAELLH